MDLPVQAAGDRFDLDLSGLAKGAYTAIAEGPGQRAVQRLVVVE
jgi:hypothetical protein